MRYAQHVLAGLLALGWCIDAAPAQRKKGKYDKAYWATDPYTKNDKATMERAGYVSFGPFPWASDHDTRGIEKMFPTVKFLFVETAHFKIGISLPPYRPTKDNKKEKRNLVKELRELKKILPAINPKVRTLDPWLRLHLFARRIEATYEEFSKRIHVSDADFPKTAKKASAVDPQSAERYMGQGPYLGMRSKFLILMMTKDTNLKRYVNTVKNLRVTGVPQPYKFYFTEIGSLFFGTSCETGQASMFNDHSMHCHMVFNTTQSLVDGYKDFFFELPVWCREGIAHWFSRRIDPKEQCFTAMKDRNKDIGQASEWDVKTRRLLKNQVYTPGPEIMRYMKFTDLSFRDHMAIWSRVDFLLSQGNDKFARFMDALKNRIRVPAGEFPKHEQVWAQQSLALREAYGLDVKTFDAAWKAFVRAKYPRK